MLLAVAASSIHKWLRKSCLSSKQRATFIFITGRWQLLSQDATLIRNPVLYATVGGGGGELGGGLTCRPGPSPQWGWTIIEGTHRGAWYWGADDGFMEQKESARGVWHFLYFYRLLFIRAAPWEWGVCEAPVAQRTQGGRRRINKLIKI